MAIMAPGETPETEQQASPEEEAMLQQATEVAMQILHGEGDQGDKLAQMVLDATDVAQGIGKATATLIMAVEQVVPNMTDDVKMALAQELVAELSDLAIQAGALAEGEMDESLLEKIVSHAYSEYLTLKEATGELDPAKLQADVEATRADMQQQPERAPQGLFPME